MTTQGIASSDFQSLNDLKLQAKADSHSALPEVAKQFEAIFLQAMLKSMRTAQTFLDESSPFSGKNQQTFQEMLDAQYANGISNVKGVGLAQMLTAQLERTMPKSEDSQTVMDIKASQKADDKPKDASIIDNFVSSIWPYAKEAASVIGLDPKLLLAQAALETGWGKMIAKDTDGSSSHNLFNIKTGSGQNDNSVTVQTTEYIANTPIKISDSFRKYSSIEASFKDYINLITGSSRYQNALGKVDNPEQYVQEIHKAGYATDPQYSRKILSIYHGDELKHAMKRCGIN